jgi:hypothetical protein
MQTVGSKLTDEQHNMIPVYRERYLALSQATKPMDVERATSAVLRMYDLAKIDRAPGFEVLTASDPIEAARMGDSRAFAIDGVGGRTLFQAPSYIGVVARNNFFVEVLGAVLPKPLEQARLALNDFVESCGGVYFHSQFCVIYDKPSCLSFGVTEAGNPVLHSVEGPALAWGRGPDGGPRGKDWNYAVYAWQGTRVPPHWIEDPPKNREETRARAEDVLQQSNQETMRAGCELLGWANVLDVLDARTIDEHPDPKFGRLVEVDLPNAPAERFLVAECGTGRTIAVLASKDATSAVEAGAISYNVPVELYSRMKVRT